MKVFLFLFSFLCFYECSEAPKSQDRPLQLLVVTDDRRFNREAFFELFDSYKDVNTTNIHHPEVLNVITTDSIQKFDAIVFYDMPEQVILTETQKQNFINFFNDGAPVIFLHHALLSYREWDEFPNIIGGRYFNKSPLITEQGDTLQSVYQHDVRYKVNIVDPKHPITLGMEDFEIQDEVYNNYYVKDDVTLLLTTEHALSGHQIGWINTFGKSQIVFLLNGHNETAYRNKNFRQLLHRAIHWVASNKANEFNTKLEP